MIMTASLQHQFSGFLETPQIWNQVIDFPYPPFLVDKRISWSSSVWDLELPGNRVLGKRMEQMFEFYLTRFSPEKILAKNEQIIHSKQTLGELDFLLHNQVSGQISHVELVYKFYLYDPEMEGELVRWVGPNHRDNLWRKLNHLQTRQFPLLHRPETRPLLDHLGIRPEEVVQQACFKANLFVPWKAVAGSDPVMSGHVQGSWLRAAAFTKEQFGDSLFFVPKKNDWPVLPKNNTVWFSFETVLPAIHTLLRNKRSPLIWMKDARGYHRIFLVWW